jgi:hypothetical protein
MLIKNTLVFLHLLAMAMAVGKMLEYDFRFLRFAHLSPSAERSTELLRTKTTMTHALQLLWLTGLGLVYLGYTHAPTYLENEKLWMKVVTVSALTLNGVLMHRFAFPHMLRTTPFLALPLGTMLGLGMFASMSSVSWLFASFLGIARSWNNTVSFQYVLGVYLGLLAMTALGAAVVLCTLRQHHFKRASAAIAPFSEFPPSRSHHA